jgi:hypothetical protein
MTTVDVIARARSAVNQRVRYRLGKGGYDPASPYPAPLTWGVPKGKILPVRARWLDCSGFIAWVIGRSRKPSKDWKWWLSTDSVWSDASGKQQLFDRLPRAEDGCIAVYPDSKGQQGHIAIVTNAARHEVIDCSSSHGGVAEHEAGYFWRKAETVWCRFRG